MPKLIISIHGGIANFNLQSKLKNAIEKGLINVANTSKIWIITGGTNTGITVEDFCVLMLGTDRFLLLTCPHFRRC